MAEPTIDELSPSYVREKRFDLSLNPPPLPALVIPPGSTPEEIAALTAAYALAGLDHARAVARPAAGSSLLVYVGYDRCKPSGVMLPLVLEVQGPSAGSYQRHEYTKVAPTTFIFTPREGGPHLVTLREVAHNKWFGTLSLRIAGELFEAPKPV